MNNKILIIAAILVMTAPAFAGSISISSITIPTSVSQGDSFSLVMAVLGSSAEDVSGTITLPTGITCTPTSSQTISLDAGGSGSGTWTCSASVAGDYSSSITASVTATDTDTTATLTDSEQTGLTVLSPASLTATSIIASPTVVYGGSTTMTIGINNAGDSSTTFTIAMTCPTGTSCSPGSVPQTDISGSSVVNQGITVTGSTAGSYTITAIISSPDQAGITTTKSLTVNASTSNTTNTTTTTSSTSTTTSNTSLSAKTAKLTIGTVLSGITKTIDAGLKPNDTSVRRLEFTTIAASTGSVVVTVDKLASKPASITPNTPAGRIYTYIEINVTNLTNNNLSGAKIDFAVNKSWITANSVNRSAIALYRFASGVWNKLVTNYLAEDPGNIIYRADSPGFSVFAVWAPSASSGTQTNLTNQTNQTGGDQDLGGDTQGQIVENQSQEGEQPLLDTGIAGKIETSGISAILMIALVPIIIVILIVVYFFIIKSKSKPYHFKKSERKTEK